MKINEFKKLYEYVGKDKIAYVLTNGLKYDPMTQRRKIIISLIKELPDSSYVKMNCNVTKNGIVQFQSMPQKNKFNSYIVKHSILLKVLEKNGLSLDLAINKSDVRIKTLEAVKAQEVRKVESRMPKRKRNKVWIENTKNELIEKSTKYEKIVFKKLDSAFGKRVKVQRPFVINGKIYFADICIKSKKLIIEVDGGYHKLIEQKEKDDIRDKAFESIGYRTIRITNEQTMDKKFMQSLIQEIKDINIKTNNKSNN